MVRDSLSTEDSAPCYMVAGVGGESGENIWVLAESLCCPPETTTTLLIGYTQQKAH